VVPVQSWAHESAAAFWRLAPREGEPEVTISPPRFVSIKGIRAHRSRVLPASQVVVDGKLAVTSVLRTLVDLTPRWGEQRIEDAPLFRASRRSERSSSAGP
jgi:hypothetical protein